MHDRILGAAVTSPIRDTTDLLAEHEAAGGVDHSPTEVSDPADPSHVDPWHPESADLAEAEDG